MIAEPIWPDPMIVDGTKLPIRDVRYLVANVARMAQFGRD
jgi:hypothetical protein